MAIDQRHCVLCPEDLEVEVWRHLLLILTKKMAHVHLVCLPYFLKFLDSIFSFS